MVTLLHASMLRAQNDANSVAAETIYPAAKISTYVSKLHTATHGFPISNGST